MGNIISKMGLYDLFARGVTGVIVLCATDLFGIANILDKEISASPKNTQGLRKKIIPYDRRTTNQKNNI